ncbi:hypothetical protein FGF66_08975 [Chlorobaculum thiosulfatiphilum]|uniref:Uncharacterized protein n=1 Tax=Chlorobaculum thiosulfatiphilum TaxID=115852 RepID=A0A5C4S4V6_CHLTI|nr:hypothetical protein [Chlorobaculum thiosulfatiphilum]NTV82340.1 hypothetical protein [Chlorobaculum sp.]TNJ38476.1 hypothetical protein FGF66_08975 [Chlorobaculum thiosulfatiphilum]
MKLFPDKEKRKNFMKSGLPVVLAVVWTPIVWMTLASFLGPAMEHMIGWWQVNVSILVVATLLVMVALIRLFKIAGLKFFDKVD